MIKNFPSNVNIHLNYGTLTTCDADWKAYDIVCSFHKLYFVISGNCVIETGGRKFVGEKDDLFFIPANTKHSYYQEDENFVTKHWIHFTFEANSNDPFKSLNNIPIKVKVDQPKNMEKMFHIAYSKAETMSELLMQQAKIMEILSEFLRLANYKEKDFADPLQEVMDYITNNIEKNITVEELAEIMHLHPNYFIRKFKQFTGMPPMKYLTLAKMEKAKSLLTVTDTPICDISDALGYKDPAHFTKVFKASCGYSPCKFRNRFSKEDD